MDATLDKKEQKILESYENSEWISASSAKKTR